MLLLKYMQPLQYEIQYSYNNIYDIFLFSNLNLQIPKKNTILTINMFIYVSPIYINMSMNYASKL